MEEDIGCSVLPKNINTAKAQWIETLLKNNLEMDEKPVKVVDLKEDLLDVMEDSMKERPLEGNILRDYPHLNVIGIWEYWNTVICK